MQSPCNGCAERKLGCHSSCEAYKEFTEKVKAIREARLAENNVRYGGNQEKRKRDRFRWDKKRWNE